MDAADTIADRGSATTNTALSCAPDANQSGTPFDHPDWEEMIIRVRLSTLIHNIGQKIGERWATVSQSRTLNYETGALLQSNMANST